MIIKDETIWLTQKAMAELFEVKVPAISKHIKNIYKDGELSEDTTVSKMETVVNRGFRGNVEEMVDFYNLDMIISIGYRVNSSKATQFRIWATKSDVTIAKNYLEENEIKRLERAVTGYFDYIEDLIERENTFTMKEFTASVNGFLTFRRYQILSDNDKGCISRQQADAKAKVEYDEFNKTQKIISDFDKTIRKLGNKQKGDK